MATKTEFSSCMKKGLPGKGFTGDRKKEFCITAKTCTGSTRGAAEILCNRPHAAKANTPHKHREPASCPTTRRLLMKCERVVEEMKRSGKMPRSTSSHDFCYLITY